MQFLTSRQDICNFANVCRHERYYSRKIIHWGVCKSNFFDKWVSEASALFHILLLKWKRKKSVFLWYAKRTHFLQCVPYVIHRFPLDIKASYINKKIFSLHADANREFNRKFDEVMQKVKDGQPKESSKMFEKLAKEYPQLVEQRRGFMEVCANCVCDYWGNTGLLGTGLNVVKSEVCLLKN